LRISGTEEAKDEIKDMGEDVDDFVVRTKSKTDQIVRDYTAVASNQYKGISVLDDNGNLRDTYDILLDISKVYKEIQEEDKKTGTNRAQALIETLAGKNRSNIVASILQNGDILEEVRKSASEDYAGSADQELGKYLDSIEGKIARLQNRLQELAYYTIDSDGFKVLLDIVNSLITGVNSLAKSFGGLNVALGLISGFFLQKTGFGILPNMKGKGGWESLINNMFSGKPPVKTIQKTIFEPLEESVRVGLNSADMSGNFMEYLNGNSYAKDLITSSEAYKRLAASMTETELA